jgi:hypothetical protein
VPDAEGPVELRGVDHGEGVAGETEPALAVGRRWRVAVPALVEREAVEVRQCTRDRSPHLPVEPGRVGEEDRIAVAPEVVEGDVDTIRGRGNGHGGRT